MKYAVLSIVPMQTYLSLNVQKRSTWFGMLIGRTNIVGLEFVVLGKFSLLNNQFSKWSAFKGNLHHQGTVLNEVYPSWKECLLECHKNSFSGHCSFKPMSVSTWMVWIEHPHLCVWWILFSVIMDVLKRPQLGSWFIMLVFKRKPECLIRKRMTRSFIFQHPLIKLTIFRYTSIQHHQVNK